jgi:hypothetical protein
MHETCSHQHPRAQRGRVAVWMQAQVVVVMCRAGASTVWRGGDGVTPPLSHTHTLPKTTGKGQAQRQTESSRVALEGRLSAFPGQRRNALSGSPTSGTSICCTAERTADLDSYVRHVALDGISIEQGAYRCLLLGRVAAALSLARYCF